MTRSLRHALLLGSMATFTLGAHAQNLHKSLCREFTEVSTLYVLVRADDMRTFPNMDGQPRTFVQLVEEVWPEKRIVVMDVDRYNALEDVKHLFFVSRIAFTVSTQSGMADMRSSMYDLIFLKKGQVKHDPDKMVYTSFIDWEEVRTGIASSRLVTAFKEMRAQTEHPEEGERGRTSYVTEDLGKKLHADTLYVRNDDPYLQTLIGTAPEGQELSDVYPYPLRFVSPEVWAQAVDRRPEGVAYMEIIRSGNSSVVMIHQASDGTLLRSSMPFIFTKKFFAKLADAKE